MEKAFKSNSIPVYFTFAFILAEVITVTTPFFILGKYFDFPNILRKPAAEGLALFQQNQSIIIPAYYIFMVSGLLYLPLTYWLKHILHSENGKIKRSIFGALGISTAVFQAIGFSRWVFVIPFLANQFIQHPENQSSIALIYEILNRYAGMTIGEHLGFIAMGFWTIALSSMVYERTNFPNWFSVLGIIIGAIITSSVIEHFGGNSASFFGLLNLIGNSLWTFWMILLGIFILINSK